MFCESILRKGRKGDVTLAESDQGEGKNLAEGKRSVEKPLAVTWLGNNFDKQPGLAVFLNKSI